MKNYIIIKRTNCFSTNTLVQDIEHLINEKTAQGYEVKNVSFGVNLWWMPTAFVTLCK